MFHQKNIIGHRNGVLMCIALPILKRSMVGAHLKLVKNTLKTFKNLDSIFGIPFGILRSVRL